jgi:hypothetical protein
MNDAGDRFAGILPHPFPHAHHVPASGIHEQTPFFLKPAPRADLGAKGGNDHDVFRAEAAHFLLRGFSRNGDNAQPADLVVDIRVVNDFAEQENAPVGIRAARRVGQVYRPFDPVTKAELLGQPNGQLAGGKNMTTGANLLDQFAAVMRQNLRLHRRHDVGPPQVHLLPRQSGFR